MSRQANYFKLGIFVITSIVILTVFLILFGAGNLFKRELLAETCFTESVQGLSIGSEVKYKGIKIGTVKAITSAARIYQTRTDYVLVILALEEETSVGQTGENARVRVAEAVKHGLSIRLAFKGLTGTAYLETDYAEIEAAEALSIPWTPNNLYIPSRQSDMKQIGDSLNQILDNLAAINLKGITLDLEALLKTLDAKVNQVDVKELSTLASSLLKELNQTSDKVSQAMGSSRIRALIDDAQASFSGIRSVVESSRSPLNQAIDDFQKAAGATRRMTGSLESSLEPKIDSLAASLDGLMKSLNATSQLLENMVWLNSDKIRLIIENLETTSENLKQMSKDLKRYPGRLLFEKAPGKINPEEKTDG